MATQIKESRLSEPIKYADEKWTPRLLPENKITIEPVGDGKRIIATSFEYPIGFLWYELYFISDFPNKLAGFADFERCGINLNDLKPSSNKSTHTSYNI